MRPAAPLAKRKNVEQADVDVLPWAAINFAVIEGRQDADRGVHAGHKSTMDGPTFIGPAPGPPSIWPVTLIKPPIAWKIAS